MVPKNLQAALAFLDLWPSAKFFPSRWKDTHLPFVKWSTGSSGDPDQLKAWASEHPGCYFCVALQQSGLVVVDVDRKNGKDGGATLADLELDHVPIPETLVSSTPSGGEHYFLSGDCARGANKLGIGVDVPGMVPVPGSDVPGKGVYAILKQAPVAALPAWAPSVAGHAREKEHTTQTPVCELDTPFSMARALTFLMAWPGAVEGANGDAYTRDTAAKLKDLGLSEDGAFEAMVASGWNAKCSPPWEDEELQTKVRNAYSYCNLNAPGCHNPEAAFEGYDAEPPATGSPSAHRDFGLSGSKIDPRTIPAREWVLGHRLIKGYMTVTISPGGVGKSILSILELLSIATGKPLCGDEVRISGPTLLYNLEDPVDELQRRIAAAAFHHGVQVPAHFYYESGQDFPLTLMSRDSNGRPKMVRSEVDRLVKYINDKGIVAVVLDPLIRAHELDENDNAGIDKLARLISHLIAKKTGCAVNLVHHTRKLGDKGGNGNAETARGASALASAARIAHTMNGMTEADAKEWGVNPDDASWYVRIDDAKANLSPPAGSKTRWYKKNNVLIANGEGVGVLSSEHLEKTDKVEESGAFVGSKELVLAIAAAFNWQPGRKRVNTIGEILQKKPEVQEAMGKKGGEVFNRSQMWRKIREAIGVYPMSKEIYGLTLTVKEEPEGTKTAYYVEAMRAEGE